MRSSRLQNEAIRRALTDRRPGPPVWRRDPAGVAAVIPPSFTGVQLDQLSLESHAELDPLTEDSNAVRVAIDALVGLLAPDRPGALIAARGFASLDLESARRADITRAASLIVLRAAPVARQPELARALAQLADQLARVRP